MQYHIIFIGGGLNYAGAIIAQKAGLKCLLIEKSLDHLGGTCLHEGCIPSKHLLFHGRLLIDARRPVFHNSQISLDLNMLQEEKDQILKQTTSVIRKQLEKAGVHLAQGQGFVTAPNTVECEGKRFTGRNVVLGTGSSPYIPPGIDFDGKRIITSNEALNLRELPKRIAIIGGGPVALEFASFFAACGKGPHVFIRREQVLPGSHPLICENVTKLLSSIGVTFHPSVKIASASKTEDGVRLETNKGGFDFDILLVATGRRPNTDAVACNDIKVGKAIDTNEHFETALPGHFAIGDCNGKLKLAHAARAQALYVVKRILGHRLEALRLENIPRFIETLPVPYARVGLSRRELIESRVDFSESIFRLSGITISRTYGATDGAIILYADKKEYLLGGELLCPHAPDIIGTIAQCLEAGLKAAALKRVVFPHPTVSEAIGRCAMHLA